MPSQRSRHPRKTDFSRDTRVGVKIYGLVSNETPAGYRQKDAFAGCLRARPSVRRAQPKAGACAARGAAIYGAEGICKFICDIHSETYMHDIYIGRKPD